MPPAATLPIGDVVAAFYRVLLMREPDQAGLDAHVHSIATGTTTISDLLAAFLACDEFRAITPRLLQAYAASDQARFTNDHSQYGEFGILLRHWINDGAAHRIVVDVGARGRDRSNAYDLLRVFGWRGVLFEANAALAAPIMAEFAGLDFELVSCAVSDYEGRATFHIGVNDDVSSLNALAALSWGEVQRTVTVPVRRLGPQLHARAIPPDFDLLSLDIEGDDIKVLNDLIAGDHYRPRWIIIEASHDYATRTLHDLPLSDAVKSAYAIAGQTPANLILRWVGAI